MITRQLGLSEAQYRGACELAEELVAEPLFDEGVSLVARGLMVSPMIDHQGLEILREAAGVPEPEGFTA